MSDSPFIGLVIIVLVAGFCIRIKNLEKLRRKAELKRQSEDHHQAKLKRRAELKRLAEDHHQAELKRQSEDHHQAELKRIAEDRHPPPQLPPIPTLSPFSVSLSLSTHSGQPTPPRSPTPQAPSHHVNAAVAPTDENRNALLLGVQGSTTAREDPNVNENVNANATLRRRPVHTIHEREHSAPLLGAHSSAIAREPNVNEHVNSTAALPRRPVAFDDSNNNRLFGSEHQGTAVPTQDSRLRLEPTVTVPPSPSSSGASRSDVDEWRKVVALGLDEERRQPTSSVVDGRPLPSSVVPVVPPPAVLDEPNPYTLPQTPIYPTHVKSDSSVFTPSHQPPLSTSTTTTSTNAANGASGTNASEIGVLNPWNGAIATQDGELDVPASVSSAAQATTASLQTDGSGDSSSTSQLLVTLPSASRVSPQPPPFSPLSSMCASTQSTHCGQPTSPQPPTPQSPQPQTPHTTPYLLTSNAQHPHHLHCSSSSNIAALASLPSKSSPPASAILSLSQSEPISLNQEQGTEIVSDPTCSFQSSSFSDPFDLVVPESPGPFGSPGLPGSPPTSLESPFIPLSPPLPISPVPPGAGGNGTGGDQQQRQRKPLSLLGSASSVMTTTARQSSSLNPPPTSNAFYSSTDDGSTTSRQTSPTSLPARLPPPAVQPDGMLLSFPSEIHAQHRFSSPGIMSPVLSELDFVSEFGGSNDGDIASESSWSST